MGLLSLETGSRYWGGFVEGRRATRDPRPAALCRRRGQRCTAGALEWQVSPRTWWARSRPGLGPTLIPIPAHSIHLRCDKNVRTSDYTTTLLKSILYRSCSDSERRKRVRQSSIMHLRRHVTANFAPLTRE